MASFAKLLGNGLAHTTRSVTRLFGRRTGGRAAAHASALLAPMIETPTARGVLRFRCGSAMAVRHALEFSRHEPDTQRWIEETIRPGEHLWDIGANVGLYSLYAASGQGITVTAFEPVASTFAHLVDNIALNRAGERVTPFCLALSNKNGVAPLFLASTEAGMAMHALGEPQNVKGRFEPAGKQFVLSICGDDLIRQLALRTPDHLKIDVDGHELQVLEGLEQSLPHVRTVWIELQSNPTIESLLAKHGFEAAGHYGGRNRLFVNRNRAA
jgi:FkbM family methyltransferase